MTRKLLAEFLGTGFLLIGVVGSGIMGDNLSGGNTGIALMANAVATGAMLFVIITIFGPISGAHFNPVVTLAFRLKGELNNREALGYVLVQIIGGILGVWATHLMFELPILQASTTVRSGTSQWFSEIIATFGLLTLIFGGIAFRPQAIPALVGIYITGAYWFTSSTSFANPAVTIARTFSDTFAGILPANAPMFIVMQVIGMALALWAAKTLFRDN